MEQHQQDQSDSGRSRATLGRELRIRKTEVEILADRCDALVLTLDERGCIETISSELNSLLGFDPSEVKDQPVDVLLAEPEEEAEYLTGAAFGDFLVNDEMAERRAGFVTADGGLRLLDVHSRTVRTDDGDIMAVTLVASQPSESDERAAALERKNEQFELFNQIIRHDIRNDANLILEIINRLRDPGDDEAALTSEQERYIEQIEEGGRRIAELTERARELISALSQLEEDRQPIDVGNVLRAEVANASTISEDATITLEEPPSDLTVWADDMLGAVFRNLFSNAIRHNDQDAPKVRVTTEQTEEAVSIRIADNGPGLPEPVATAIRDDAVTLDEDPTTGFGLYLISTLIDQYDGEFSVEENEPRGTVASITLERVGSSAADPE